VRIRSIPGGPASAVVLPAIAQGERHKELLTTAGFKRNQPFSTVTELAYKISAEKPQSKQPVEDLEQKLHHPPIKEEERSRL
jgi:hypothetical protein